MFWIALDLTNPKMELIASISLLVIELNAFRFDGLVKSGNTGNLLVAEASLPKTG